MLKIWNHKFIIAVIFIEAAFFIRPPILSAQGSEGVVTIAAVGDIMLDRGIKTLISRTGPYFVFKEVEEIIRGADMAFGNLECPLTWKKPNSGNNVFQCDPALAEILASAGFDILSIANNHILDQGPEGLFDTISNLQSSGISFIGAGANPDSAVNPAVFVKNGIRISFLAFTEWPPETAGSAGSPGPALANPQTVRNAVAKALEKSDVVVVSFHWGREFDSLQSQRQRELALAAVRAGAKLVIGHHPHALQPSEIINGALVVYSLGNFVFDQNRKSATQSAILLVTLSKSGIKDFKFIPVALERGRPVLAPLEAWNAILRALKRL